MADTLEELVNCRQAAQQLGVSVKTIRNWAQNGKLKGLKIGTRGDWRFTNDELAKLVQDEKDKFTKIKKFLRIYAIEIQQISSQKHEELLAQGETNQDLRKHRSEHVEIVKKLTDNLSDIEKGRNAFISLGEKLAKKAVKEGLTLEEAVDGTIFIKQAIWQKLNEEGLLHDLTTHDFYHLSSVISTYIDILASKIAFTYHAYYSEQITRSMAKQQKDNEKEKSAGRESENQRRHLYNLFMKAPAFITILSGKDHIYEMSNDLHYQLVGFRDIIGKPVRKALPEVAAQGIIKILDNVLKTGQPFIGDELPVQLQRKANAPLENRYLNFVYQPIQEPDGTYSGIFVHGVDVTEQVMARKKIEESEDRYRTLFNSIEEGFCVAEVLFKDNEPSDYRFLEINRALEKQTGIKDAIGKRARELMPDIEKQLIGIYGKVVLSGKPVRCENYFASINHWFDVYAFPVGEDGERKIGILSRDITQHKKAEEELRESEQRFRNLADTAPMYIAMADEAGNAVYFNKPWLDFTGKKLDELLGMGWLSTLHPEDASKFEKDFKHAFKNQIPINEQYRFRRADGEYRWMLAAGAPRFTPDGRFIGYFGTYTDFHDLKEAQIALSESENRFRIMADNIQNLAWMANADGWIFWYNKRWYDYTGTTLEEMLGWGWKKVHHPDHVKRVVSFVKKAWKKGEAWELTFPLKGKDGAYRWFLTRAVPIRDKEGRVIRWTGTNTDIEDLKHQHEMEQRMKLLTEQRNALLKVNKTKDEFISLASHQLRTPSTAVKQYLSLLLSESIGSLTLDQLQYVQIAYDSNERELRIINDLLKTAQIDASQYQLNKQLYDLAELIKACITDMGHAFVLKNQVIVFDEPKKLVKVPLDVNEIKLAFMNLLENASKYSYPGTTIKVTLRQKDKYAEILFADNGVGIGKDNQERIFDKFTRVDNDLSDTVTGTGLGLYWVKQITELHKGSIKLRSELGKGSTFTVRLPL